MAIKINKQLTPINFTNCNNTGRIKYIVIHYVGATGGAEANCKYYASTYVGASAHYYVGFNGEIWQSVADEDIAWSVGASSYKHPACRNSNSLNIELCVRKKSTKTMNATDKDWYFEDATIKSGIELTKMLMQKYNISINNVIRHYDVTGKICPNPFVYDNTKHTWSAFKKSLSSSDSITIIDSYFRVGTAWKNGICIDQLGAYTVKENAISNCLSGYKVFDSNGIVIYAAKTKGFQISSLSGLSEKERIAKIAPLYMDSYKKTKMLPSVGIAQFCLESGYGTTDLAIKANNVHGMKASLSGNTWSGSVWDGKSTYTKQTAEQDRNGNVYYVTAPFRKYPCVEDSIADRAAYFVNAKNGTKNRYPGVAGCTDYKKAITIIKNGGYATDVNYVDKICNIIEKWNLSKYDEIDISTDVTNSLSKYPVGEKAILLKDNYIRTAPSGGYKKYAELTESAKKKSVECSDGKCKLNKGSVVGIIEALAKDNNIWIKIKNGWLAAEVDGVARIKLYTPSPATPKFKSYSVKITSSNLRIRSGAGTSYTSKGYTGKGTFTIIDEQKGSDGHIWGLLKAYETNRNGWIAVDMDCIKKI